MKIETYEQLKEQRLLTRIRIKQLEEQIKNDFMVIRNDLTPWNIASKTMRKMLHSEKHGLVGESLGMTVDVLVSKLFFRKTNFITKALIAMVAKNYVNNMVTKKSEVILDRLHSLIETVKTKRHQHTPHYDESTVDVDLEI